MLAKEPDWECVPAKAQRLLKSCLEKTPKRRLRDIADGWRLLDDAPVRARKSGREWKLAVGVLAVALAIALWAPWRGPLLRRNPAPRSGPGQVISDYLPMQKVEKMRFRMSSAVVAPVMASMGRRTP